MKTKGTLLALLSLGMTTLTFAKVDKSMRKVEFVPGEVIVKLKVNSSLKSLKSIGFEKSKPLKVAFGNLYKLKLTDKANLETTLKELNQNPDVEYAEPNYIYKVVDYVAGTPSDPKFSLLWGLKNNGNNEPGKDGNPTATVGAAGADINATQAWEVQRGSKTIRVAVIDTGIDYNHPDLKDNIAVNVKEKNGTAGVDDDGNGYVDDVYGYDFANNDADPMDGHSHGTHCAGTIGGVHNNQGVAGVMAEVSLVPVKFLSDSGSGSTEAAVLAIDYATKLGVNVMSNSWGGGGYSKALEDSIKAARDRGIVFVAAAGNDSANNDSTPHYPSSYELDNVISVASHTISDGLSSFSCYGRKSVHVAAPGSNILSTINNGGYAVYSGTSMATPHVSGTVGLLLSEIPTLSPAEVRARVIATSVPVRSYKGKTVSGGRINAYNLVTDTRPVRNEPDPSAWVRSNLDQVFESAHPYDNARVLEKTISVPGAKYLRVIVEKYDLESGYDVLSVISAAGEEADKISGAGANYASEYVEGSTLKLRFTSDSSINKWGFVIKSVEAIK